MQFLTKQTTSNEQLALITNYFKFIGDMLLSLRGLGTISSMLFD